MTNAANCPNCDAPIVYHCPVCGCCHCVTEENPDFKKIRQDNEQLHKEIKTLRTSIMRMGGWDAGVTKFLTNKFNK